MTLQTARGKEGFGHIEITTKRDCEPNQEIQEPMVYIPKKDDPFYLPVARGEIVRLERKVLEGKATDGEIRILGRLKYDSYHGWNDR